MPYCYSLIRFNGTVNRCALRIGGDYDPPPPQPPPPPPPQLLPPELQEEPLELELLLHEGELDGVLQLGVATG
ncbi:MAG: hypothetical protein IT343_21650, partial [Candidatus Melainabacteria bacterium]|nr:hypothetical protein [Candidatus Melainabacteria bacterium]